MTTIMMMMILLMMTNVWSAFNGVLFHHHDRYNVCNCMCTETQEQLHAKIYEGLLGMVMVMMLLLMMMLMMTMMMMVMMMMMIMMMMMTLMMIITAPVERLVVDFFADDVDARGVQPLFMMMKIIIVLCGYFGY